MKRFGRTFLKLSCISCCILGQLAPVLSANAESFFPAKSPAAISRIIAEAKNLEQKINSGADPAAHRSKFAALEQDLKSQRRANTPGLHDEIDAALGYLYDLSGDANSALRAYESSLKARANQPDVLFRYGRLLRRAGDNALAQRVLEEARWRGTKFTAEVEYELGECALALKAPEKAAENFARARAINPSMNQAKQKLYSVSRSLSATAQQPGKSAAFNSTANALLQDVAAQQADAKRIRDLNAQLILQSDALAQHKQLETAVQAVEDLAYNSDCADDQTVKVAVSGALKLRQIDRAERVLKCGLQKSPKSADLLNLQKQIQIERGLNPQ